MGKFLRPANQSNNRIAKDTGTSVKTATKIRKENFDSGEDVLRFLKIKNSQRARTKNFIARKRPKK